MKLYAAQAAFEVADDAIQLFGGNGYVSEYRVEQLAATRGCCRSTPAPTRCRSWPSRRTCCATDGIACSRQSRLAESLGHAPPALVGAHRRGCFIEGSKEIDREVVVTRDHLLE